MPGILLVLCCLVPFLNKAFTIDDPCFLLEARQILKTPLQPMSFPICWTASETCVKNTGSFGIGSAQALMGYALVPVILAGSAEWVAHAIQMILACIAVIEMVRLALWFGCSRILACAAGLLLAAIPPFLPTASTAMPDMLGLTLGLAGMERLFAWKSEHRRSQALIAGLMLGLAPWARPHWAMLLPLVSIWLFDEFGFSSMVNQFRRHTYLWAPVLLAVCVLLTVNLITRPRGPFLDAGHPLTEDAHPSRNLFAYLLYLAVPIPIAAVWLISHWRKIPFLLFPAIAFAALTVSAAGGLASHWAEIAVLCTVPVVVHLFYVYWGRNDRTGLLLGLWLLIPLPAVFYAHFPIKYMMAVLPAAVLILLRTVSGLSRARMLAICGAIVFICAAYSCMILKADQDFAEYGRRAAAELIAPHVAAGEKVWYGGEWGFYWYAQRAGAEVSQPAGPGPRSGQLLAVGIAESGDLTRDRFPNRVLVDRRQYNSPHGRTMLFGAGLHTNMTGNALWVWNPEATNEYELWKIQ
ncbi:MAG: hypothetical protein ABSG41_13195 [Bryobacteraceae bacterium]|jgi:hypothetical protein